MSFLQKFIYKIPIQLQKPLLRILYAKAGYKLQDFRSYYNNSFFLYKVDGVYVPSASIGWFVHHGYYKNWVDSVAASFYSPQKGDTIIDIGAGMGEEALIFSESVGEKGKVFCIEANPEVFDVLQDMVSLNKLNNVRLFNVAISPENKLVKLEKNSSTFLAGRLQLNETTSNNQYFSIPGTRLDSFVHANCIEKIDLLKANIEGAERFVIETMGDVLQRVQHVAISCHDFRYRHEDGNEFFRTKELVSGFLEKNGFLLQSLNTGVEHKDDWIFGTNNLR